MSVTKRNDIMKNALRTHVAAEAVGHEAAAETAERARNKVPVDTGTLKGSIRVEGDEAKVGDDKAPYAGFVDKGTLDTAPTHFWSGAVEDGKHEAKAKHSAALRGGRRAGRH